LLPLLAVIERPWDAAKKSLDVGQKPVNLRVIKGIKAPCLNQRARCVKVLKRGKTIV
jgi:hypothetical protein